MSSEEDDLDSQHEEHEDHGDKDGDGSPEQTPAPKALRKEQREKRKFDFERNERTVFVGNLPSTMNHRAVEKLFKSCGPIDSARIRSIVPEKEKLPPKVALITQRIHPKVDSVNAFVVFAKTDNDDCIKKALAMNGKIVGKHHIRVDRAQHPNSKRMTLTSRKKSVFVGNLRFDLRDDDLIAHFSKAGEVDFVRLVRDRATGLGKGFGFVKFMERAAVKEALKMNDTGFKGRQLRVKKIDEKMKIDDDDGPKDQKTNSSPANEGQAKQVHNKSHKGGQKGPADDRKQATGYERRQQQQQHRKDKSTNKNNGNIQNRPQKEKFDQFKEKGKQEKRVKFDLKTATAQKRELDQFNKSKVTKKDKKKILKKKIKNHR